MELMSSQKNIRSTTASGMIHREHLLNASRRPQTSKRARRISMLLYRTEEKKRDRNWDVTYAPEREL